MLNNKSVLITGGTGSFGKKFTETILGRYPKIKRLVIYSRDELKQFEMSQVYNSSEYPEGRYLTGPWAKQLKKNFYPGCFNT